MLMTLTVTACVVACAAAPTQSSIATPNMSIGPGPKAPAATAPTSAAVDCLGGVPPATCEQVLPVVLTAVAPTTWTPTHVWINSGFLCPAEDCLFDPNQNFPYPMPPDGGQWVANAEIAFAGTDKHAGVQIAQVGSSLVPVLIGYRTPLLDWCSGSCPSTVTTDGQFRLELVMPHQDWKTTDTISGTAILDRHVTVPTTIYGSGMGLIGFEYDEVGGNHHVLGVMTADCRPYPLDPATPINAGLSKSGAVGDNEPDAAFLDSFLADPQIHLPAGIWDITAIATFMDGDACSGSTHSMKATVRITVEGQ